MTPTGSGSGAATALTIALTVATGALLSIERKALAQLMLARPIVVGPLLGALLGDPAIGLAIGIPLELYFLANASYGASTPDHETWTALFAAGVATGATGAGTPTFVALPLAAFLALPLAPLGRRLERALEHSNERLLDQARTALETGNPGRASRRALPSLIPVGLVGAGITFVGIVLGPVVGRLAQELPSSVQNGLSLSWALFSGVCAALALRAIRTPGGPALSGVAAFVVFAAFAATLWWAD